jgi:hypothetical protein
MTAKFSIGDRVRFLNEKGGGVVVHLLSSHVVTILTDEGFEINFRISELVKDIAEKNRNLHCEIPEQVTGEKEKFFQRKKSVKARKDIPEIDLHIDALLDDYEHLSPSERLRYQLDCFMKFLHRMRIKRNRKVIVIHGVGSGMLKHQIRKILDAMEGVRYQDASMKYYGSGATEVIISYR